MVAKIPQVDVAVIRISKMREDFARAIHKLAEKTTLSPAELAAAEVRCFESPDAKLNRAYIYLDPKVRGRIIVRHHHDDFEAVNDKIRQCGSRFTNFNILDRGVIE
jgi:hypothetical protein